MFGRITTKVMLVRPEQRVQLHVSEIVLWSNDSNALADQLDCCPFFPNLGLLCALAACAHNIATKSYPCRSNSSATPIFTTSNQSKFG